MGRGASLALSPDVGDQRRVGHHCRRGPAPHGRRVLARDTSTGNELIQKYLHLLVFKGGDYDKPLSYRGGWS